ncbi:TPA: ZAR1-like protein-like [Bos taurus]|nr:TPA: ZAR1-like protein-like [Bos taurus]
MVKTSTCAFSSLQSLFCSISPCSKLSCVEGVERDIQRSRGTCPTLMLAKSVLKRSCPATTPRSQPRSTVHPGSWRWCLSGISLDEQTLRGLGSARERRPTDLTQNNTENDERAREGSVSTGELKPSQCGEIGKANTKDVGVQVSLRVGKSVQCSLGPRTLDSLSPWASAGHRAPASAWGVSSSVPGHWGEVRLREELSGPPEAGQPPPPLPPPSPPPRSEEDPPEELQPREELVEEDSSSPRERKSKPAPVDSSQPLGRPNFQFLEPKYGYFHCKDCKTRWESAYVWCISGTNKVYFKQLCCKCQKSFNPYRVEAIQCQCLGLSITCYVEVLMKVFIGSTVLEWQVAKRKYPTSKVSSSGHEEIPHVQGLHLASAEHRWNIPLALVVGTFEQSSKGNTPGWRVFVLDT